MTNLNKVYKYINLVRRTHNLTLFLNNIFEYNNLNDYNYIFRMKKDDKRIIIDIYDNISMNRFNRYIIIFDNKEFLYKVEENDGVFVTYVGFNFIKIKNNITKFLNIYNDNYDIEYLNKFMDKKLITLLEKKPI